MQCWPCFPSQPPRSVAHGSHVLVCVCRCVFGLAWPECVCLLHISLVCVCNILHSQNNRFVRNFSLGNPVTYERNLPTVNCTDQSTECKIVSYNHKEITMFLPAGMGPNVQVRERLLHRNVVLYRCTMHSVSANRGSCLLR
jgi:hypothetical protein